MFYSPFLDYKGEQINAFCIKRKVINTYFNIAIFETYFTSCQYFNSARVPKNTLTQRLAIS
ncbi:MAG: hypothetical protein COT84_08070 [Chlamydiae bacterium CG10_big_fil_rev_8_21_14_0_10_35_9]|nr:MAG: hypothetical protein COT84_08070 [Chlamydiae bacterium CG10_big_fil_rev_8_21_14_0_10_35_9]